MVMVLIWYDNFAYPFQSDKVVQLNPDVSNFRFKVQAGCACDIYWKSRKNKKVSQLFGSVEAGVTIIHQKTILYLSIASFQSLALKLVHGMLWAWCHRLLKIVLSSRPKSGTAPAIFVHLYHRQLYYLL